MVATIRNETGNIVGFRLINTKTGELVDSEAKSVARAIAAGHKVKNLKIEDGVIKGVNGSLDRYTKLLSSTGEVIDNKSPLVVVHKIKRKKSGMKVVDFKGVMRDFSDADCVKYAKHPNGGIANGKVVGNHISSIEGEYDVVDLSLLDEVEEKEKYTGEIYDYEMKPLLIYAKNYNRGSINFRLIDMQSDDKNKESGGKISKVLFKDMIEKYDDYNLFKYGNEFTLIGKTPVYMDLGDEEDRQQIREYLRFDRNRANIDSKIQEMKDRTKNYKEHRRYVKAYDVIKPIASMPYGNVYLDYGVGATTQITNEEAEYYLKRLELMGCNILKMVEYTTKDIVLNRKVYGTGIRYRILTVSRGYYYVYETKTLEEIYVNREKYQNVREVDGGIAILGTDYEAVYDMSKIHKTYGREVEHNSEKTKKAEVLGYEFEKQITRDGRLLRYSNNSTKVISLTDENIKRIAKNSIKLHEENKKIIFGEQLTGVSNNYVDGYNRIRLDEIEVRCGEKATIGIINSLRNISLRNTWPVTTNKLIINRDLTPLELMHIIDLRLHNSINIYSNNVDTSKLFIDDDILVRALELILEKSEASIQKSKNIGYTINYYSSSRVIGYLWENGLKAYASPQATIKIKRIMEDFDKRIKAYLK